MDSTNHSSRKRISHLVRMDCVTIMTDDEKYSKIVKGLVSLLDEEDLSLFKEIKEKEMDKIINRLKTYSEDHKTIHKMRFNLERHVRDSG